MSQFVIKQNTLPSTVQVPPSKSHTLRAILFGSLAQDTTTIHHPLPSPDTDAMIAACTALGAEIQIGEDKLEIRGFGGKPTTPSDVIDAGNSGQVLRFIGAVAALCEGYTVITGDASIRHNRPVEPLLEGLRGLNAFATSTRGHGNAPIIVRGPLSAGSTSLQGQDSQPVSGLLIAAAFGEGPTEVHVEAPGELPWIDVTLGWFDRLAIPYENHDYRRYTIPGSAVVEGFEYSVPGDFSSAAFPIAAAIITNTELAVSGLDMRDSQGDKRVIEIFRDMGANIDVEDDRIVVRPGGKLSGINIDVNDCIDAVPILAAVACYAEGKTIITNAAIARRKECDRLTAMSEELRKLGADITETPDGLVITKSELRASTVDSHNDHRVAMALSVAALGAQGHTTVRNTSCVSKTFLQ